MRATPLLLFLSGWIWGLLSTCRSLGFGIAKGFAWAHRRIYQPVAECVVESVLGAFEEYSKSVVREWFNFVFRMVNACSLWVVSRFDSTFHRKQRRPSHWEFASWENWRPSTFNWIIERENDSKKGAGDKDCAYGGSIRELEDHEMSSDDRNVNNKKDSGDNIDDDGSTPKSKWSVIRNSLGRLNHRQPDEVWDLANFFKKFSDGSGLIGVKARSGWVEDIHITCEVALTWCFSAIRSITRLFFLLPKVHMGGAKPDTKRSKSGNPIQGNGAAAIRPPSNNIDSPDHASLPRIRSMPSCTGNDLRSRKSRTSRLRGWEKQSSNAFRFISESGYPLEDHDVLTEDGYILTLHRLPRPASRNAVFFQHGILDTSMSWCANGVTGSLAFQAYEAGYDVWLGNCRANPPRRHGDLSLARHKYWDYSLNELGLKDIGAQLEFIHKVKCGELEAAREGISRWKAEHGARNSVDIQYTESPRADGSSQGREAFWKSRKPVRLSKSSGALDVQISDLDSPDSKESEESRIGLADCLSDDGKMDPCKGFIHSQVSNSGWDEDIDQVSSGCQEASDDPNVEDEGGSNCCDGSPGQEECSSMSGESGDTPLPYQLRAVGHSLGGAAMLIYLVMSRWKGKPHYLSKLILLSPAGFHPKFPALAYPFIWILPLVEYIWKNVLRKQGVGVMIPGRYPRKAVFKGLQDILRIPGLRGILNLIIRGLLGGDRSPWDFAMQLPHYGEDAMPGISLHSGLHLIQMVKSQKFRMYDYKDPKIHMQEYGIPEPVDLAEEYHRINIPVDIVAGTRDGVIPPSCVKSHFEHMLQGGVKVSYKEFAYSHLEFSFTVPDDLTSYVIQCLSRRR